MEYLTKEGYPNYELPEYQRDNWCNNNFMECEGDCGDCPNEDFFARVDEALQELYTEPRLAKQA